MRYLAVLIMICLAACANKKQDSPGATASDVDFPVENMTCASSTHQTLCSTAVGVTQTLPSECSKQIGAGGMGVPIESAGRTTGVYYTVSAVYDCGVRAGLRCIFIDYANGWQDMRCDDWELP